MSRLPMLARSDLDEMQAKLHETITGGLRAKAPRKFPLEYADGSLAGPFNVLLYNPGIGSVVQELGSRLRFEGTLPGDLREVAILTVAAHWRSNYEWFAHATFAEREGVSQAAIAAIKAGDAPADNEGWATVHRFVSRFLESGRIDDGNYADAEALLGSKQLVELVTLTGYYCMISGLLNCFEIGVPEGEEPPFGG